MVLLLPVAGPGGPPLVTRLMEPVLVAALYHGPDRSTSTMWSGEQEGEEHISLSGRKMKGFASLYFG